jgi:hypothetical protein
MGVKFTQEFTQQICKKLLDHGANHC